MRRLVEGLVRFILRIFFRRVETAGAERVPSAGPVVFCPNHPNALIDAALMLATAPRPVSFLAKAPLFRMPVIGWFARSLGSIPVYRRQDGSGDTSGNAEMFAAARRLLEGGGTIAIFPEGTSHSDTRLRPLRTGAARIALGAGTEAPVTIIPVALTYFDKATFRSNALVSFGEPIVVTSAMPLVEGEPDPGLVAEVTSSITAGLGKVVLEADAHEALALADSVDRLFQGMDAGALHTSADFRRTVLEAYPRVRAAAPARVASIQHRLDRHEVRLRAAGLDPGLLELRRFTLSGVLRYSVAAVGYFALTLPFALPGIVVHWPAYRLVGIVARRASGTSQDVVATAKTLGAMLFFPLTWLAVGMIVGSQWGWPIGAAAAALSPILGWMALRFVERIDSVVGAMRALALWLAGRDQFLRMQLERRRLRAEIVAINQELGLTVPAQATGSSSG